MCLRARVLVCRKSTTEKRKVTSCVWKLGKRLCTHLCQSTEHSSHRLVVQPLRAVDDNDIHAHSLPQVLYCLCLPCARWALGAAPTIEVEGCSECHVAARWWGMRTGRMKTMTKCTTVPSLTMHNDIHESKYIHCANPTSSFFPISTSISPSVHHADLKSHKSKT